MRRPCSRKVQSDQTGTIIFLCQSAMLQIQNPLIYLVQAKQATAISTEIPIEKSSRASCSDNILSRDLPPTVDVNDGPCDVVILN